MTWLVGFAGSMSGNTWKDPFDETYPACPNTGSLIQKSPSSPMRVSVGARKAGLTVRGEGIGIGAIVTPGICAARGTEQPRISTKSRRGVFIEMLSNDRSRNNLEIKNL